MRRQLRPPLWVFRMQRGGDMAPGWMLVSRPLVFAGLQLGLTATLWLAGDTAPSSSAARWWLVTVTLGNVATLWILADARWGRGGVRTLWRFSRTTWRGDLWRLALFTLVAGPVGWLPNVLLARALWSTPDAGNALLFRPLPLGVLVVVALVFPVTQALAELPLYFGEVGPRLRAGGWPRWAAVLLPALVLGLQHMAMPLVFDVRYLAWRALMFLPFALLVGVLLDRRPTLLPWLLVVHGLMDAQLPVLTWLVTTGAITF